MYFSLTDVRIKVSREEVNYPESKLVRVNLKPLTSDFIAFLCAWDYPSALLRAS